MVTDEAELKVMTMNMYRNGGVGNVMECVRMMVKCQKIVLDKLAEILASEEKRAEGN